MRYSGIGGQAIMEGVMMRNRDKYAVAVRLSDGSIKVNKHDMKRVMPLLLKVPFVRGVFAFIQSLSMGLSSLMESASYFEDEEDIKKRNEAGEEEKRKMERREKAAMGGTLLLSFMIALLLFLLLPYYLSKFAERYIESEAIIALIEGIIRVVIFMVYLVAIAKTEDIHRVFMYHGAEHKCINCIEAGEELTVENVKKATRFHKRCGTSFLFIVVLISVVVFMFIRVDSRILQLIYRLILIPVIAGIAYEFIRLAGRSENRLINFFSLPGLWMQRITTAEPDDDMIRVGIASVEAVFDWRGFLKGEQG